MADQAMPSEKVADKIRKLLNLAKGGATEGEAALAMGKVQELLAIYNLSMTDINDTSEDSQRSKDELNKFAMYAYQRKLMAAIADCHYCLHWITMRKDDRKGGGEKAYHVMIGRKANTAASQIMFEYLNSTINRLVLEHYPSPQNLSRSAISWKDGCADRLIERLKERKALADAEQKRKVDEEAARASHPSYAGSKNALVLLTDVRNDEAELNRDLRYGYAPGTTRRERLERASRQVAAKQVAEDLESAGEHPDVVLWVKMGYSLETARRWLAERKEEAAKEERRWARMSPEKRAQEELRQERASERFWEQQRNKQERATRRRDHGAYESGRERGDAINLDKQIDKDRTKSLGSK